MLELKFAIVSLFLCVTAALYFTARFGREIRFYRQAGLDATGVRTTHICLGFTTFFLTLVAIMLTEIMVRKNGGIKNPFVFGIHIPVATIFLIMLIFLLLRPMVKLFERYHKLFGKICLASYGITLLTGMYLIAHV